jgi:hypothetical protein
MKNKRWWAIFVGVLLIAVGVAFYQETIGWKTQPLSCPVVIEQEKGPYYTAPAFNGRVFKELW